jgi:hypothetical protein
MAGMAAPYDKEWWRCGIASASLEKSGMGSMFKNRLVERSARRLSINND